MKTGLILVSLILALSMATGITAVAATSSDNGASLEALSKQTEVNNVISGKNFIDVDGDGVCDNKGTGNNNGRGFIDKDNDGICDRKGTQGQQNCGNGFVDSDGDGVCDNKGICNNNGRRFIDEDNDGICDRKGTMEQQNRGNCIGRNKSGK